MEEQLLGEGPGVVGKGFQDGEGVAAGAISSAAARAVADADAGSPASIAAMPRKKSLRCMVRFCKGTRRPTGWRRSAFGPGAG